MNDDAMVTIRFPAKMQLTDIVKLLHKHGFTIKSDRYGRLTATFDEKPEEKGKAV